jgi:phosphomethylpyrimidine synthase
MANHSEEMAAAPCALALGPFPRSRKVYVCGSDASIRVPMRVVDTASGPVVLYDTSGPYTDPGAVVDIRKGLAPIRSGWIRGRTGPCVTQMHYARKGVVTPEMEFAAIRENMRIDGAPDGPITPEIVREDVARGRPTRRQTAAR